VNIVIFEQKTIFNIKIKCHCKEAFENVETIAKLEHEEQTPMQPGRKTRQLKGCADLVGRPIQFSRLNE